MKPFTFFTVPRLLADGVRGGGGAGGFADLLENQNKVETGTAAATSHLPAKNATGGGKGGSAAKLPELKSGTEFDVLATPEETWANVWRGVRAALVRAGHKSEMRIRCIERVRVRVS